MDRVEVLVKEELCEGVVEVQRSGKVMSMVLMFGEAILRVICAFGPQSGRTMAEKQCFYDELARK